MDSEADCSMNLPESFARWDQDTLSWRTSQRCLLEGWEMFLAPWPRSGMTASGTAYRLPTLAHRISGTESSFWPTPSAQEPGMNPHRLVDKNGNQPTHTNQRLYDKKTGRLCQKGLSQAVHIRAMISTPTTSSFWPTPTTQEIEHPNAVINNKGRRVSKNGKSSHSIGLADAVKMIPTPTTSNAKRESKNRYRNSETCRENLDEWVRDSEDSGQLNPTWVEWLMGFPEGWTDLDA